MRQALVGSDHPDTIPALFGAIVLPKKPSEAATIANWDLTNVKRHLMRTSGFSQAEVDQLEIEYKRFLVLVVESPVPLPISAPVDPMWHEHVLFTRDYEALEAAVGRPLHHNPYIDESEVVALNEVYEAETIPRYKAMFGSVNERYWPKKSSVCMCCDC